MDKFSQTQKYFGLGNYSVIPSVAAAFSGLENMFHISGYGFQEVWLRSCTYLMGVKGKERNNFSVSYFDFDKFDKRFHNRIRKWSKDNHRPPPEFYSEVIFPSYTIRKIKKSKGLDLFKVKDREKMYRVLLNFFGKWGKGEFKRWKTWGTYFERIVDYKGEFNQLDRAINNINNRVHLMRAGYFFTINIPGKDNVKKFGDPCLSQVAIQAVRFPDKSKVLGLLAFYRNWDLSLRAYGNLRGLADLLKYICYHTGSKTGKITVVASHVYIEDINKEWKEMVKDGVRRL